MLALPNELLEEILHHVERLQDRKNLRRTCSRLALVLRPYVLKEVTLNIYKGNAESGMNLLGALAAPKNVYSPCVRTLYIDSLSPSHYPIGYKGKTQSWRGKAILGRTFGGNEKSTNSHLRTLLKPALESLEGLEAIRWCWQEKDSQWSLKIIMQSFSALRDVKEFTFYYGPIVDITIPYPDLPNLRILSISTPQEEPIGQWNWTPSHSLLLKHLLNCSSSLSALHLDSRMVFYADSHLGHALPEMSLHSSITHLSLSGWSLPILRPFTAYVSKLPNLTSLRIFMRYHSSSPLKDFFSALSANHIHLRRLVLDGEVDVKPVLDYIEGYSGLEVLCLIGVHSHPYVADRFYRIILPLHNDTLVELDIQPLFQSTWCFGTHNAEAIRRCRKLRRLSVGVSNQVEGQMVPVLNPVYLLLRIVSSSLPELQALHIDSCYEYRLFHRSVDDGPSPCNVVPHCEREIPYDPEVLRWVRICIGGEKLTLDDAMGLNGDLADSDTQIHTTTSTSLPLLLKAATGRFTWKKK
ncbi:hypothetical protein D9758_007022 [Tetrapyrgos nigripes]|uniref:F-box domain-containing protein n=1 Tax=Tetrapyrgos nigripes TaxID=182062 RepID=A0A8H5GDC3_9AGAR|nr:hypothetical protein D9758_007022 [Tetrapyrgos nigripes]